MCRVLAASRVRLRFAPVHRSPGAWALGAFTCGDPNDPQPTTGSLSGTVRDAETRAPIKGVILVVAEAALGETGSYGGYRIDNIPPGTHQVSASAYR